MPIFDLKCQSCQAIERDSYISLASHPTPPCPCGGERERLIGSFSMPFCGVITARYNDRKSENAHREGHYATRLRTPDGKPRTEFISTFQQQKEFCKAEGLVNPKELPSTAEATSDRKLSSAGMPGSWV